MRLLIFFLFAAPIYCLASGPEDCHLEGALNGKIIKLRYEGGGKYGWVYSNLLIEGYKHCEAISEGGDPSKITCSNNDHGKFSTIYKRQSKKLKNGSYIHPFVCVENCSSGTVNELYERCQDEGE